MEISFTESTRPVAQGVKAVGDYYAYSNREISHAIKNGEPEAIRLAARAMSQLLTKSEHRLLIPVPSHTGKATYTLRLAEAIAKAGCGFVYNVLKCSEREPLYTMKKRGEAITLESLGFCLQSPVPEGWEIVFIDNVVATGTTAAACRALVGRGDMLVFAVDSTANCG